MRYWILVFLPAALNVIRSGLFFAALAFMQVSEQKYLGVGK